MFVSSFNNSLGIGKLSFGHHSNLHSQTTCNKKRGVLQAVLSINPRRLSGLFCFNFLAAASGRKVWRISGEVENSHWHDSVKPSWDFLAAKIAFCRQRFVLAACRCSAHEATLQAKFNRKPHSIVFLGEWTSLNYLKFFNHLNLYFGDFSARNLAKCWPEASENRQIPSLFPEISTHFCGSETAMWP